MADNFFRVKNGLNLPTLAADPTVTPPDNSEPGDMAMYNGDLYIRQTSAWSRALIGLIDTAGLEDDAVTADKLANNAVTEAKLATSAVTEAKINSEAVTNAKLASNAVTDVKVDAAAAIAGTKISPDFGAQNVQTTGSVSGNTLSSTTTVSGTAFLGNAIGASGDTSMKNVYGYARIESPVQTALDAGNETIDCSLKSIAKKTGGTATITLDNLAEGQTFTLVVTSTGSAYTITWSPTIKWPSAVVPAPTENTNSRDIYTFTKIGGEIFGTVAKDLR